MMVLALNSCLPPSRTILTSTISCATCSQYSSSPCRHRPANTIPLLTLCLPADGVAQSTSPPFSLDTLTGGY